MSRLPILLAVLAVLAVLALTALSAAEDAAPIILKVTKTSYTTTSDGLDVVAVTDANGHVTKQYRDGLGRLIKTEYPNGGVSTQEYDAGGNVTSQTDPNGITTRMTYDGFGRVLSVTDGAGNTVRRSYDEAGNVVSETDALGNVTRRTYDGLNRLASETDRLGHTTHFTYDAAGNRTAIKDAEGGVTTSALSPRNELVSETFPGPTGGTKLTTYDPAGRVATRTDQRGITTTYAYDATGLVLKTSFSSGGENTFSYDLSGRLIRASSSTYHTTVERSYTNGRLSEERQTTPFGTTSLSYTYDALGHVTATTLDDGTHLSSSWTSLGQVAMVSLDGQVVVDQRYDLGGRLVQRGLGNGLLESRTYTPTNQLASLTVSRQQSLTGPLWSASYAYDSNRRKTSEQQQRPEGDQESQVFAYDAGDRLLSWSRTPSGNGLAATDQQSWTLSPVGDWTSTVRNGRTESRQHTPVHEVTALGTTPLSYDANGNLTRDTSGRRSWYDAENRLSAAEQPDPRGGTTPVRFVYDALGRRLARISGSLVTVFVQHGSQVLQERDLKVPPSSTPEALADEGLASAADTPAPAGALLDVPGSTHLNFQPASSPIPEGWIADKGRALASRTNGLTYGWTSSGSPTSLAPPDTTLLARDAVDAPELDTLAAPPLSSAWQITGLTNGTYAVVVVAGDPTTRSRTNDLTINGQVLTDPDSAITGTSSDPQAGDYDGWAITVTVTDGTLTLTPSATAVNPSLCFLELGPPGSQADAALQARVAEAVRAATARTATSIIRPPTPRTFVYGGDYIDAPLVMKAGNGPAAALRYIHSNALWTPQALTDSQGHLIESYSYTAYGERTVYGSRLPTVSDAGLNFGFTGLRDEGGLLFARARFFSPTLGRWTQRDPAGYVDGYGLYGAYFVPGGSDPTGLFVKFQKANEDVSDENIEKAKAIWSKLKSTDLGYSVRSSWSEIFERLESNQSHTYTIKINNKKGDDQNHVVGIDASGRKLESGSIYEYVGGASSWVELNLDECSELGRDKDSKGGAVKFNFEKALVHESTHAYQLMYALKGNWNPVARKLANGLRSKGITSDVRLRERIGSWGNKLEEVHATAIENQFSAFTGYSQRVSYGHFVVPTYTFDANIPIFYTNWHGQQSSAPFQVLNGPDILTDQINYRNLFSLDAASEIENALRNEK